MTTEVVTDTESTGTLDQDRQRKIAAAIKTALDTTASDVDAATRDRALIAAMATIVAEAK